MAKKTKKIPYPKPKRLSFPDDEVKIEWLSMLLDAYFNADQGVFEGIRHRMNKGDRLACAKGCSTCCTTHITIPVYPMELMGIYWYVIEQMNDERHGVIQKQLQRVTMEDPCPFLIEGACGIHLMRPMACRHFNVFNRPCDIGEDPYFTRRDDVLTPLKKFKDKALSAMLPFHGIKQKAKQKEAMKQGLIHDLAQNLQEIEWGKLAERME